MLAGQLRQAPDHPGWGRPMAPGATWALGCPRQLLCAESQALAGIGQPQGGAGSLVGRGPCMSELGSGHRHCEVGKRSRADPRAPRPFGELSFSTGYPTQPTLPGGPSPATPATPATARPVPGVSLTFMSEVAGKHRLVGRCLMVATLDSTATLSAVREGLATGRISSGLSAIQAWWLERPWGANGSTPEQCSKALVTQGSGGYWPAAY